ncbi:O-antigen ligase family protein [Sphingopyxis macrogoltabida]|uniref:O-antigen ligase-related domain-containing protein n=1 Tax=Sphingopyxis macrogoltabida TaxID=33050 RepID=A0A0N9V319_SPHMC|nr:O-antigen ligase family protein [Sphingopyxis macrogoltabida]ALH82297.1 hypothetical protein AN936_18660 [Sphingopyxis macrogoltabida]
MNVESGRTISQSKTETKKYWLSLPIFFLVFVFILGGASRSDVASLPVLRAGCLLFAFWTALELQPEDWRRIRMPLLLLVALTIWMAVQLIPLPPELWHSLRGRDTIVTIDRLLDQSDVWRPISLTPSQTANSLLAMSVPISALLVIAATDRDDYAELLLAFVAIACLSVVLGIVQIFSGSSSVAYLYRITSADAMVGLFANRNHHAVFIACCVPIVATLIRDEMMRKRRRGLHQNGLLIVGFVLVAMTALIGSRAGLGAGILAFMVSYIVVLSAWRLRPDHAGRSQVARRPERRFLTYVPPVLMAILLGLALWLSSRTTGFSRLVDGDIASDLRVTAWPTVEAMIAKYWVFGSGFGSFPDVYEMFEPDKLLQPSYFNHAHNDWAEVVMTGGVPFALILLGAIIWIGRSVAATGTRNLIKGYRGDVRLCALMVILFLAIASIFDYPLRVPSIQVMAVFFVVLLCCPKKAGIAGD